MKANTTSPEGFESTYAMILRSEEKERSISEIAVYAVLIMSTVFSVWQLGQYPFMVPTSLRTHSSSIAQSIDSQRPRA